MDTQLKKPITIDSKYMKYIYSKKYFYEKIYNKLLDQIQISKSSDIKKKKKTEKELEREFYRNTFAHKIYFQSKVIDLFKLLYISFEIINFKIINRKRKSLVGMIFRIFLFSKMLYLYFIYKFEKVSLALDDGC